MSENLRFPKILYRNLARIPISGLVQLNDILKNGLKSKAQLFIEGEPHVQEIYKHKGWTIQSIRDRYGHIMETGICDETYSDGGALYDELNIRGPSPLISSSSDKVILLNWGKGPIIGFSSQQLNTVNVGSFGYMVVNFIPASAIREITIFNPNVEISYRTILAYNHRPDISIVIV